MERPKQLRETFRESASAVIKELYGLKNECQECKDLGDALICAYCRGHRKEDLDEINTEEREPCE